MFSVLMVVWSSALGTFRSLQRTILATGKPSLIRTLLHDYYLRLANSLTVLNYTAINRICLYFQRK